MIVPNKILKSKDIYQEEDFWQIFGLFDIFDRQLILRES